MNTREEKGGSVSVHNLDGNCVNCLEIVDVISLISTYLAVIDMACGFGEMIHIFS